MANRKYIIKQLNRFFGGCRNAFTTLKERGRLPSLCMGSFFINYFISRACGGNLQGVDEGSVNDNE